MRNLSNTKAIFQQLGDTPGTMGVKSIIENHDAWVNNAAVQLEITAAMRLQLARQPRGAQVAARIEAQRQRLQSLVTTLPRRISTAV